MRRRVAVLSAAAVAAAAALPVAFAADDGGPAPATYLVGGDVESINPTDAMLANNDFFLGGYGFGSGRPGNVVNVPGASDALGNRYATGVLGDNSFTRFPSPDGWAESDGESHGGHGSRGLSDAGQEQPCWLTEGAPVSQRGQESGPEFGAGVRHKGPDALPSM